MTNKKMKIPTRKKIIPLMIILPVLLLVGYISYAYQANTWPFTVNLSNTPENPINYAPPTDEQVKEGNTTKKRTITDSDEINPKTGQSNSPENSDVNTIQTQITAASIEAEILYIRNEIDGIYQTGNCTLILSQGGTVTITKTSGIQALPKASTCKGFNIPSSELHSGLWDITLKVDVGNKSGVATAKVEV